MVLVVTERFILYLVLWPIEDEPRFNKGQVLVTLSKTQPQKRKLTILYLDRDSPSHDCKRANVELL